MIEFAGVKYDDRHGGAFDRGAADSYYHRSPEPHYYEGPSYFSDRVPAEEGSVEYESYMSGYAWNEKHGDKKNWD